MYKTRAFLFPSKRVGSLLLTGAVFVGLTTAAFAQATFSVASAPLTTVAASEHTAPSGEILFTQIAGTSVAGTIRITYTAPITSPFTAVTVTGTGGYAGAVAVNTDACSNTGGYLVINVPPGVVSPSPPEYATIQVSGVRLDVAGTPSSAYDAAISAVGNAILAGEASIPVIVSTTLGISSLSGSIPGLIEGSTGTVTTQPILAAREGYLNAFRTQGAGDTTSVMVRFRLSQAPPSGVSIGFPSSTYADSIQWVLADSDGNVRSDPQYITSTSTGGDLEVFYKSTVPAPSPTVQETLLVPVDLMVEEGITNLPPWTVSYTASLAPIGQAFDLGGVILAPVPRYAADEVGPATLFAVKGPPCMPTSSLPTGFVAFDSLTYATGTNLAGDRLIVGSMAPESTDPFTYVPLPNAAPDQQFCTPVEIAPGLRVMAYVPTAAERAGDFSAFNAVGPSGLLADPLTGTSPWGPFPGGIIPVVRQWGIVAWRIPAQPFVYYSTYTGNSVLGVDGRFGSRQQGGNAPDGVSTLVKGSMSASPESIVVGPDGKMYVAEPDDNRILRMSLDGTQQETVMYLTVQGPTGLSFNSLGDLYFNTRSPHTGVWKITAAQLRSLPATPVNVVPADCGSGSFCTDSTLGGGTTFDWVGNLLIVDTSGNRVLISSAPSFDSIAQLITTNLDMPTGIAVDKASGDILVASFGSSDASAGVNRYSSSGSFLGSAVGVGPKGLEGGSRPGYIALDATGVLYIATSQGSASEGLSGGKVWRVSFTPAPELEAVTGLLTGLCGEPGYPPCSSLPPSVGVAVAPSSSSLPEGSYSPPPQDLHTTIEPDRLTYDFGPYNYVVDYIGYPGYEGLRLRVDSLDTTLAEYQQRVSGTAFEDTTCSVFDGTGGYCEMFRLTCENILDGSTVECPENPNPYTVTINWNTLETITDPGLLKAPLGTSDWENILTFFSQKRLDPPDPTGAGRTCCRFSDFVPIYNLTGTAPGIAVGTPSSGAVFALNQPVLADYSCTDPFSVVSVCLGTVPKGEAIDTSSLGSKTFEVNATVSAGPAADVKVEYQVVGPEAYKTCLLYDSRKSLKPGSTVPVRLMICDGVGHNFSNPNMVLTAVRLSNGSTINPPIPDPGYANPDGKFRFDPRLGKGGGYIFNLSTKGLKKGTWKLWFTITGDPTEHYATFILK